MEMQNNIIKIDFEKDFDFESKDFYKANLNGEELIFTSFKKYDGPITLQFLPNGGIQSLFGYILIIKVNNGFLGVEELIYKGKKMSSKEFIELNKDKELVNQILE